MLPQGNSVFLPMGIARVFWGSIRSFLMAFLFWSLASTSLNAGEPLQFISRDEFKNLAEELSKKVNIFQDLWRYDRSAEFFGGTVRDYLYWLKKELSRASSPENLQAIVQSLREKPLIDIRDFVIGDSDVDIAASSPVQLEAADYGIRKIDWISKDRFDPKTEMGLNERLQGYIPVEKMRLGYQGFVSWDGFGNGLDEIYGGQLTIHFSSPEDFKKSFYALRDENHPILLVLRYLRLLAMDYFYSEGRGHPDNKKLFRFSAETEAAIRKVVEDSLNKDDLRHSLRQRRFVSWINGAIKKAFRSYTNPTATHLLFKYFRISEVIDRYAPDIQPINQYLFSKSWSAEAFKNPMIKKAIEYFPDLELFHGTKTEEQFVAILRQGILPSDDGTAGAGLYGVPRSNLDFSISWGGSADRIVKFKVHPDARVLDLTTREGREIIERFHGDYEKIAETYGADIICYPYNSKAYVVKNSAVLDYPEGLIPQIFTVSQLENFLSYQKNGKIDFDRLVQSLRLVRLSSAEIKIVLSRFSDTLERSDIDFLKIITRSGMDNNSRKMILQLANIILNGLKEKKEQRQGLLEQWRAGFNSNMSLSQHRSETESWIWQLKSSSSRDYLSRVLEILLNSNEKKVKFAHYLMESFRRFYFLRGLTIVGTLSWNPNRSGLSTMAILTMNVVVVAALTSLLMDLYLKRFQWTTTIGPVISLAIGLMYVSAKQSSKKEWETDEASKIAAIVSLLYSGNSFPTIKDRCIYRLSQLKNFFL